MLRKIATIFVVLLLLPVFVSAQEHTVLKPDGKIYKHKGNLRDLKDLRDLKVQNGKQHKSEIQKNQVQDMPALVYSPDGTIDTLKIPEDPGDWGTFGFSGGDWMLTWFVAPADLDITHVGYATSANTAADPVETKIVRLLWPLDSLMNAAVLQRGWYEADNPDYNDITAFADNLDVTTGDWISFDGSAEPFGFDIWSDGGQGSPSTPVGGSGPAVYQFVAMVDLGEPSLLQGDIFGIATRHNGPLDDNQMVWYADELGIPGWKFYANGRLTSGGVGVGDPGWWTRTFSFNQVAVVNLTGDRAPVINSFTSLSSGPDLGPYTIDANITDDNPSGVGGVGVASATLSWTNDGGDTWNDVAMTGTEPNFSGEIPAQSPNTDVSYFIEAADVESLTSSTLPTAFFVFGSSGAATLVVFNGHDGVTGYPQAFYWGSGEYPANFNTLDWDHDSWAYGALSAVVLDNYTNVIEIATAGPVDINSDAIRAWLEADGTRNYLLVGDEWLGVQSGWTDGPHAAGSFHFDILGINFEHNDVMGTSAEAVLPSEVFPQASSLLGGNLLDLYNQVSTDNGWTSPLVHDPWAEITVPNWMDGVDFEADVEVDMMGLGVDGTTQFNIGGHRTLPAGNKIGFFAFDPLSLDTDAATGAEYYWYGFTDFAPQWEFLKWLGVVSVERENNLLPEKYSLSQNFPNPFNPSTTIKFSVPQQSDVVLKVYDILGSEVANLVNETLDAGNYTVNFDASQFASGMYIYKITAGNFVTTKKMMLLK